MVLVLFIYITGSCAQFNKPWNDKYENNRCPKLYPKNFINYAPVGNLTAGNYTEQTGLKGLRQCVMACCLSDNCNIVFIFDTRCYHVECVSNELCLPLLRAGNRKWESHVSMILVKPVLPNENWSDLIGQSNYRDSSRNFSPEEEIYAPYSNHNGLLTDEDDTTFLSQFINNLPIDDEATSRSFDKFRDTDNELIMDATGLADKIPCVIDDPANECPYNFECITIGFKRSGICKCVPGTEENAQGECVPIRPYGKGPTIIMNKNDDNLDTKSGELKSDSTPHTIQNLTVSVAPKKVQLPDNEVTLAAFTIPDEKATMSHYSYAWTLVDQPKGGSTGNMNQNGATVKLTGLTEGEYRFKVTVNGTSAYGEGFGNVTVLPRHRINKPPQVFITPQQQTVKLPTTGAVLDGSASKDDDQIISWHWELISGPIGYQPPLEDGSTLVLKDLKQAGNYTFKLTVEDSDHAKNYTMANITVLNHTDYPPEANAGQDVIIYLPNNNITLNGSLSTDDHEITSWEWTKDAEDENKAVDMQNTHSPYLQLSNLSEGVYTFVLKVTDSSGQWSTAEVRVFVKPPTNTPPVANAGTNQFISLPQTWVTLNGSGSHDDHTIVAYTWRYLSGPTNSNIINFNESIANATALTKGMYTFSLTVLDNNGNTASDNVTVTVTQNKNSPPKADAGGDQVLSLPLSMLILNGTKSSDDFRIVSWRWARVSSGMAAGTVVLNSDTQPVLMLTNIETGRYVFELTVTDDQGESSHDTVSIQVKPDPLEMHLLELTLNIPISTFSKSRLDSLIQKMTLLLKEDTKINITEIRGEVDTENTQLIFFLFQNGKVVDGKEALSDVRETRSGWSSGGVGERLRSVKCLSTCSGRGHCDQATRSCRCDAFWMQNLLTQFDEDAEPNCDWSVVYASIGGVATLVICAGALRAVSRLCTKRPRRPKSAYRLLPAADHEEKPFANKDISDTDTESDVLFDTNCKTTSFNSRIPNGEMIQANGWKKNGHYKGNRKIKT